MTEPANEVTDGDPVGATQARLAALQRNSGPPALAARILTAGFGASMVFGLIAAMSWSDNRATGADSSVTIDPTSPTTGSTSADGVVTTVAPVTAVPPTATTVPPVVPVPVVPVPVIEVPVATPVPATVSPPAAAASAAPTEPPVATTRQSD